MAYDATLRSDVFIPEKLLSPVAQSAFVDTLEVLSMGNSNGALDLRGNTLIAQGGEFVTQPFFNASSDAVRQDTTSAADVDPASEDMGNGTHPVVFARYGPKAFLRVSAAISASNEEGFRNNFALSAGRELATYLKKRAYEYWTTAIENTAAHVNDDTTGAGVTITYQAILETMEIMGDASRRLKLMIMHSKQWFDLVDILSRAVSSGAPAVLTSVATDQFRTGRLDAIAGLPVIIDDDIVTDAAVASSSGGSSVAKKYYCPILGTDVAGNPGSGIMYPDQALTGGLVNIFSDQKVNKESPAIEMLGEARAALWQSATSFDSSTPNPTSANLLDTSKYTAKDTNDKEIPGVILKIN